MPAAPEGTESSEVKFILGIHQSQLFIFPCTYTSSALKYSSAESLLEPLLKVSAKPRTKKDKLSLESFSGIYSMSISQGFTEWQLQCLHQYILDTEIILDARNRGHL